MNDEFDKMNSESDPNTDKTEEEFTAEVTEVTAEAETDPETEAVPPIKKPKMSRKKKILIITLSVLLALVLAVVGLGAYLFNHYYNQMNIEKPAELDAVERILKLFDSESGERYTFTVNLTGLNDADTALVDNWYISEKELVISVGKDPAVMTEAEKTALLQQILTALREQADTSNETNNTIKVLNTKDGREYEVTVRKDLITDVADYGVILEYLGDESGEQIMISFEGDPAAMTEAEKTALFVLIAAEIRNMQKVRYPLQLKDAATGKESVFMIYEEELNEDQAKLVLAANGVLTLTDLPADFGGLDAEQRTALIERIVSALADLAIPRYTIRLRDPASNTIYDFVMKQTELTDAQLAVIVKQIDRGMLDLALSSDPNELDEAGKAQLILDILAAIDLLENPPKVYQITVKDRTNGKTYTLSFNDSEVTDAQLIILLPKISEGNAVSVPVSADPSAMSDEDRLALIAEVVAEIASPSRALLLQDSASGKSYTLYFRDNEVSASQLSYLTKQIGTGKALVIAVAKDPDGMTADEKTALITKIVEKLQAPPAVEYKITVRDSESGTAYILRFTKDEVNDEAQFGYLLAKAQDGTVLDMTVASDPQTMTGEERKALFAAAVTAIKAQEAEENDPDLLEEIKKNLEELAENPVQHTEDIYNVLLVGTDERDDGGAKNSDTMILVTVNYKDETITLTSLMRDTCVEYTYISGGKERVNVARLNSAHAVGGMKTLISAIESNYGVTIDNYVKVNWFSFLDVFEVLGNLEVNVPEADLETINTVIKLQSPITVGHDGSEDVLTKGGKQYLNANQILAFCRYRTSTADFARTERQRMVLSLVFEKFKSSSLSKINNILEAVLPMLTTDLTKGNCMSLLLDFAEIVGFKMQQVRLPEYQEYTSYKGMLVPDWKKTLHRLYTKAYGSLCPEQYK